MTAVPTEHLICHQNLERLTEEYRQQLDAIRNRKDADGAIGRAMRSLLLPGNPRRTFRREDLARIVNAADRAAGVEK